MILTSLTVDELICIGDRPTAAGELVRRLQGAELFTKEQVEVIEANAESRGINEARPDAIDFLICIIDGELWREQLDEDSRDWIKSDLLMLLEPMDNGGEEM